MATEWYLMNSPHNQISGFEEEAFNDFATEGFQELLDSSIATKVRLYNGDMTLVGEIKVFIIDKIQDTQLKTTGRQILANIGTFKAGMYIEYKGRFWLITGLVDDNGVYEKGVATLCEYLLTWQNADGKVIQRWADVTSASQYNYGERDKVMYRIRSDQLLIIIPNDEESLMIPHGQRFVIDKRTNLYEKRFLKGIVKSTENPLLTYSFTRTDNVIFNYEDSGCFEFMVNQDEKRDDDGYYVINDKGYWLCGKLEIKDEQNKITSVNIVCDAPIIYNGLGETTFMADFRDENGQSVDNIRPIWNVETDFGDKLNLSYNDNLINIAVDDDKLVNKTFVLSLKADGYNETKIEVSIKSFF